MRTKVELPAKPTDGSICVVVDALSKRFGAGVQALTNVSFQIKTGEAVAVIGANGSGKSTLLRTLFGLCQSDSGSVNVLGSDPATQQKSLFAKAGYLAQQSALDPEMTGYETFTFFANLAGLGGDEKHFCIDANIKRFELGDYCHRRVSGWSGGMRQRLHLAIAALGPPKLLLMDEPTSGLDPDGVRCFWNWVQQFRSDQGTLIVATHDLANVARFADHVLMLGEGRLLADDTPQRITQQYGQPCICVDIGAFELTGKTRKTLESLSGIAKLSVFENQIYLQLTNSQLKDTVVLQEFESLQIPVVSYRRETDLASAYFSRSGRQLSSPSDRRTKARTPGGGRGRNR